LDKWVVYDSLEKLHGGQVLVSPLLIKDQLEKTGNEHCEHDVSEREMVSDEVHAGGQMLFQEGCALESRYLSGLDGRFIIGYSGVRDKGKEPGQKSVIGGQCKLHIKKKAHH
jgi:hypothetical protein